MIVSSGIAFMVISSSLRNRSNGRFTSRGRRGTSGTSPRSTARAIIRSNAFGRPGGRRLSRSWAKLLPVSRM
ncbi:hypothetical protein L3i22_034010 [Actinoplanes sp. L3-i22]|nr:hypothetical protein L3i22_034010 [Actinoplanes sp. L3-i22]